MDKPKVPKGLSEHLEQRFSNRQLLEDSKDKVPREQFFSFVQGAQLVLDYLKGLDSYYERTNKGGMQK